MGAALRHDAGGGTSMLAIHRAGSNPAAGTSQDGKLP